MNRCPRGDQQAPAAVEGSGGPKEGRSKSRSSITQMCFLAVPVSLVAFILTQNPRIVDPRHIGWLWGSGDIASSFTQWLYFRETSWVQWPLTVNPAYGAPWTKTIIFSDTPPIFAVPMKYLTSWIDGPVQYTGPQILVSMYLLVLFSALTLLRLTQDRWISLTGAFLVSVSPMLLFRDVFFHYSLNIMWVIPAALFLMVGPSTRRSRWAWGALVFITLTWMPYFVVCVLVPWVWDTATRLASRDLGWRLVVRACVPLIVAVAGAVLVNALWFNYSVAGDFGLGYYNANLLTLVNPAATASSVWSRVLPSLPVATDGQYEGFAYLGIGVLLILPIAAAILILRRNPDPVNWSRRARIAVAGALATCGAMSLGFNLTVGAWQVLTVEPPEWMAAALGTFRSSGRFMLVIGLGVTLLVSVVLARALRPRLAVAVLLVAAVATLGDAWPQVQVNRAQQGVVRSLTPGIEDAGRLLDAHGVRRITFIEPEDSAYQWKMDILGAAALRTVPVNDAFVARPNLEALEGERSRTIELLAAGSPGKGNMWVLYPDGAKQATYRLVQLSRTDCVRAFGEAVVILDGPCVI